GREDERMTKKPKKNSAPKSKRANGNEPKRQSSRASKTAASESVAPNTPAITEDAFPVVGIGASAGGLEAYKQLLQALPGKTGAAYILVQHLDPSHASMLSEILSRATSMPVMEVQEEATVEPNHVYVIPPGRNMIIAGGALKLLPREQTRTPHRPVDV